MISIAGMISIITPKSFSVSSPPPPPTSPDEIAPHRSCPYAAPNYTHHHSPSSQWYDCPAPHNSYAQNNNSCLPPPHRTTPFSTHKYYSTRSAALSAKLRLVETSSPFPGRSPDIPYHSPHYSCTSAASPDKYPAPAAAAPGSTHPAAAPANNPSPYSPPLPPGRSPCPPPKRLPDHRSLSRKSRSGPMHTALTEYCPHCI